MPELTKERVRKIFDYSPENGDLIRKVRTGNNVKVGDVVGSPSNGYLLVMVDCKSYLVHRIIWLWMHGCFPDQIDHINQCRSDNRLCNLRSVNNQENHHNKSMYRNNLSGFVGVCWHKPRKKWMAHICVNGKKIHLGRFVSKTEAISARQTANIKYGFHQNHGMAT